MPSYYTSITLLSCLALGTLCLCVWENGRLEPSEKRVCWLASGLIAASALAEWLGVALNGSAVPGWLILAIKCCDYILTPMAVAALVAQTGVRNRWSRTLNYVVIANAVMQLVLMPFSLIVRIDETNHYSHGPLYPIYAIAFAVSLALSLAVFATYGAQQARRNRASLVATYLIVLAGIVLQETSGGTCRTTYAGLSLAAVLMYVRITEYAQLRADDHIRKQEEIIVTDALSGLLNRYAYSKALEELDAHGVLPARLAMFSADVNGLKEINDTLGHAAGDELIRGAAQCLSRVFGKFGECYRTGGDEFMVLAEMEADQAERSLRALQDEAALWQGSRAQRLSMAAGYAFAQDHRGSSAEELATRADRAMYSAKEEYYRRHRWQRRGAHEE